GRRIRSGESVQVNSPEGMTLELRDGSQVELRSQSQLQLDRATDGLRMRLNAGSVIVTAAQQGQGHLYVETKEANVSVVGSMFAVSVEKIGSRVGVIEAAVSGRESDMSQQLLPGQQLSTNPAMVPVSLDAQISWSRNAARHLARFQQSVPPPQH